MVSMVEPGYRGIVTPGWVRDPLWQRAQRVPTLDLRFAANRSLRDAVTGRELVTFTRASSATVVGPTGLIETVANDVPRFQHDPTTGACLGLLVEEQRANSIRNNTMVGAVAGTPGTLPTNWVDNYSGTPINGISRAIVGTGTDAGITYLDYRISGTATTGFSWNLYTEQSTVVVAANGQSWTTSAYLGLAAGSTTGITAINLGVTEHNGSGVFLAGTVASASVTAGSLATKRVTASRTFNNASTAFANLLIQLSFTNGAAIDITLRIGLPQLEQGAFVTMPILTSGTSATRSADIATATALGSSIRSLFAQVRGPASGTRGIIGLDDNSVSNRIELLTSGTDPKLLVTTGGSAVADLDGGTVAANVEARLAARFAADNYAISVGGGAEVVDTAGALPAVDRIRIGALQAGNTFSGTIARLAAWDTRLESLPLVSR
ncbi:MAG: Azospirillum phage Cd [Pseudomonadota bacterium]|jgi:hypothetical protein